MQIQVRLYGALGQFRPRLAPGFGAFDLDVAEGATAASVAAQLGIPSSWGRSTFVNGEAASGNLVLKPGDQLVLAPPTRGGCAGGAFRLHRRT